MRQLQYQQIVSRVFSSTPARDQKLDIKGRKHADYKQHDGIASGMAVSEKCVDGLFIVVH